MTYNILKKTINNNQPLLTELSNNAIQQLSNNKSLSYLIIDKEYTEKLFNEMNNLITPSNKTDKQINITYSYVGLIDNTILKIIRTNDINGYIMV